MPSARNYPLTTKLEGAYCRIPRVQRFLRYSHGLFKWYYTSKNRRHDASNPSSLRNFEKKVFSQFGEDGIIEEIFRRIGEGRKITVEFGVEDGYECNSRFLIEQKGWSALLMDGSPKDAASGRRRFAGKPVQFIDRFLTVENICATIAEAGIPDEFDLLSVDVDGNDLWLWEAIQKAYRPRVVVIEYNGRWAPPKRWAMPYNPSHQWDGTAYYGASLQSMADSGEKAGYKLVCCTSMGLNAFFVRNDQLADHFPDADKGAAYHYAAPTYRERGFGHPVDVRDLELPPGTRGPRPEHENF